jgi:hypothetical protein
LTIILFLLRISLIFISSHWRSRCDDWEIKSDWYLDMRISKTRARDDMSIFKNWKRSRMKHESFSWTFSRTQTWYRMTWSCDDILTNTNMISNDLILWRHSHEYKHNTEWLNLVTTFSRIWILNWWMLSSHISWSSKRDW